MKLSVIILATNAEKDIQDCLDSVSFADESIIVHGNIQDKTLDIAKLAGARFVREESESFADKRNAGLKASKGEWILYIDTDERVTPELKRSIEAVVMAKLPDMDEVLAPRGRITSARTTKVAYKIRRQNFYLGNNPWPNVEQLERLFKKEQLKGWYGRLHESPTVTGEIGILDGLLEHYTHKDLSSMLTKTIHWSQMEAKLRFEAHHPQMTWWRFPRVMVTAFWDSYVMQQGYKAGTMGLIESMFQAFSMFITYARLWEMQRVGDK